MWTPDDYRICIARPTGGKAGKGRNKTSTIQVFCGSLLVKSFRFRVDDPVDMGHARILAEQYVRERVPRES